MRLFLKKKISTFWRAYLTSSAISHWMNAVYLVFSLLNIILAIVIFAVDFQPPLLAVTARHQFDDWKPLLAAFRDAQYTNSSELRATALKLAWCDAPLPPNTTRAPYCGCVERTYATFSNKSQASLASARNDAVMDLVGCLSNRPVWRVAHIWGLRFTTPAIYLFFIVSSFLLFAAEIPSRFVLFPVIVSALLMSILLMVQDYIHNSFWIFMFFAVVVLFGFVLKPGFDPERQSEHNLDLISTSFWWCEYLICPVFALYVPIMHCGRDLFLVSVFTMIGTAIGGLGLRSFWCSRMYAAQTENDPKSQFMTVMQYIVWLGILASCVSLSFLTAVYYNSSVPYVMGPGSVGLLAMTFVISLLQWPGYQEFDQVLTAQQVISIVRVVIFFALVVVDISR